MAMIDTLLITIEQQAGKRQRNEERERERERQRQRQRGRKKGDDE